ncbi:hypothetical protein BCR41DRAFT_373206 [Lobosporangium transversale]|uniref:Uncharacterized protein n=1 Tax=Lobosporangium transversale TaxID=64571 RepID=A0A1Y2GEB4_9FUNG|nr:hypothetical protein BCR41DRAFT_373206 [Lobosporangium transversale]ORZ08507.1 hypothetical protein BCR41DRAFT_373206 [Lobosporangium transversale]|eukprot:XP_021878435.1 hypothetical protein BCR41DRAFT_373206 [Lobosporangium transversale]
MLRRPSALERAIGQYIEQLSATDVSNTDRKLLDLICPRIFSKSVAGNEGPNGAEKKDNVENDENETNDANTTFLLSLLMCIYNKRPPTGNVKDPHVLNFIHKAKDFLPAMADAGSINTRMRYPGSVVLRSTATQLKVELRRNYKEGAQALCEKIEALKNKGLLLVDTASSIDPSISAVENFVRLNKSCNNSRKLAPLSAFEDGFINLSELELIEIFWQDNELKAELQVMPEVTSLAHPRKPTLECGSRAGTLGISLQVC